MGALMNDQSSSLSPETLRPIMVVIRVAVTIIAIAAVVITLVDGADALLEAIAITAVILVFTGWERARARTAMRSPVSDVVDIGVRA